VKLEFFIDALDQFPPPEQSSEFRKLHIDLFYRLVPSTRVMNAAICSQFSASSVSRFRPCLVME